MRFAIIHTKSPGKSSMVTTKILSSTILLQKVKIIRNRTWAPNQHISSMISEVSCDISINSFIIPVWCDHQSTLLLTICSEDTWENHHSLWIQQGDIDLRPALSKQPRDKSPLIHTKRLHTHCLSGTDFASQKCNEKVQLSWKINYLIISQNPIQISDWRGNERVPLLKDWSSEYLLLFWYWHFPLCFRKISHEVYTHLIHY